MQLNKKKIIFTVIDIAVVIIAGWWVMWLCFYFSATIDGAIYITSKYNIFERNYLVPTQIFGITIILTVSTIIIYRKLQKNEIIGKKYIILALFNIIPFWFMSIIQIISMVYSWEYIY
ncbi:MAG: hypothetical protein K2O36_00695 [Ruminococcus sp.]|nr:hypothetical protein [Ruminococcus sp.]